MGLESLQVQECLLGLVLGEKDEAEVILHRAYEGEKGSTGRCQLLQGMQVNSLTKMQAPRISTASLEIVPIRVRLPWRQMLYMEKMGTITNAFTEYCSQPCWLDHQ